MVIHILNFCYWFLVLDNGPARSIQNAQKLQKAGDLIGDVFEISTIRREDMEMHKGHGLGDDIRQSNNQPSSKTQRGHQGIVSYQYQQPVTYFIIIA